MGKHELHDRCFSSSVWCNVCKRKLKGKGKQVLSPTLSLSLSCVCVCVCVCDRWWWASAKGVNLVLFLTYLP